MRIAIILAALTGLVSCGGTTVPVIISGGDTAPNAALLNVAPVTPVVTNTVADSSFRLRLNDVRLANGAGTLVHNEQLDLAAQNHAQDMLDNDYFSHTGLNGSSPGDRATLAGYDWRTYGENIAAGYTTEEGVMAGWTNSPGHHANNINPNFQEFGLGLAQDGNDTRWVLMLGAR